MLQSFAKAMFESNEEVHAAPPWDKSHFSKSVLRQRVTPSADSWWFGESALFDPSPDSALTNAQCLSNFFAEWYFNGVRYLFGVSLS